MCSITTGKPQKCLKTGDKKIRLEVKHIWKLVIRFKNMKNNRGKRRNLFFFVIMCFCSAPLLQPSGGHVCGSVMVGGGLLPVGHLLVKSRGSLYHCMACCCITTNSKPPSHPLLLLYWRRSCNWRGPIACYDSLSVTDLHVRDVHPDQLTGCHITPIQNLGKRESEGKGRKGKLKEAAEKLGSDNSTSSKKCLFS